MQLPRNSSEKELAKVKVRVVDRNRIWLQCDDCGQKWSPELLRSGRLPRGYWKCPNGCNTDGKTRRRNDSTLAQKLASDPKLLATYVEITMPPMARATVRDAKSPAKPRQK